MLAGETGRRRAWRALLGTVAGLALLAGGAAQARAATYTVGTTADSGGCASPPAGVCTLRQLIQYENGLSSTASPPDTIVVPAGTYNLTGGALTITQSLSIAGAGARTTTLHQSSTTPDRVVDVQMPGAVPTVRITGLTLSGGTANSANGFYGGDVRNVGTLTLSEDWITGGTAASGSGGGIANDGGTLTVSHSLVSGNTATNPNGGGDSGGILNHGGAAAAGKLVVDNSTIANNTAALGGGVMSWGDTRNTTTITNSTIAYNDGGSRVGQTNAGGLLVTQGSSSVQSSIVSSNTVDTPSAGTPSNCGSTAGTGSISSLGYNLEDNADCAFQATGDLQNRNPQFTSTAPQNNGGNTDSFGLVLTGPAVDHIPTNASGCGGTDQRDVTRPQGAGCDIGAYEFAQPAEGGQLSGTLATATCAVSSQPTIAWGDGTTSPAGSQPGQPGLLTGTHTYGEEGTYSGSVSWTDDCGSHTVSFTVAVPDAALHSSADSLAATIGKQFSGPVATFSDADPGGAAPDYAATIDWGDGATSPGSVSTGPGGFVVNGSHTYLTAGSHPTTITISDVGGSQAIAQGNASVAPTRPAAVTGRPKVTGSTGAGFTGSVNPGGLPTTATFQYGLDARYRAPGSSVYDKSTPTQQVGSDFAAHSVAASASGLVPNAVYHVRLVATNRAGTTYGPDMKFKTAKDPKPPPPPVLGKSVDLRPVSGLVLFKSPKRGQGFIPLTEGRQIPDGSQIDARRGTLALTTAAGTGPGMTQTGTFTGGVFKLTQTRAGANRGLTTLTLLEGAFPGAPTYASCAKAAADRTTTAHAARLSSRILQTLRAHDNHGRFATRGRYSAATVRGTQWNTSDRCDGTLTVVHRGTVSVSDFVRHITILVHAGHRYLAKAKTHG